MTITPPLTESTSVHGVADAERAIIAHVRAHALRDPFWESITVHYASEEVTITVVNLVDYDRDARSGGSFGPALVHDVLDRIEFLRAHARSAAEKRAAHPHIPSLVVYRDGETARLRLFEARSSGSATP